MKTAALLSLVLVACGSKGDELANDLKKLTDEMCKCTDGRCVEGLEDKRDALRKKSKEMFKKKEDVPEGLLAKLEKIDDEYKECRDKLQGGAILSGFTKVVKDDMCKCKEQSCAEEVNKFEVWMKENDSKTPSSDVQDKAKKIAEEYTKCMMTAMSAGSASP